MFDKNVCVTQISFDYTIKTRKKIQRELDDWVKGFQRKEKQSENKETRKKLRS